MSLAKKSRYQSASYHWMGWLFAKPLSFQLLTHQKAALPTEEPPQRRLQPVNHGDSMILESPVSRRGVRLRCFRSCQRPVTEDGAPLQQTVDPEHSSTTKEPTCEAISAEDVCALREEVASLRVQLEELIAAQKGQQLLLPGLCLPPPPPPPPPPPLPPLPTSTRLPMLKVVPSRRPPVGPTGSASAQSHDSLLREVLKGLGTVTLRKIEKSPSGTPLRKKAEPCNPTDPAGLLATALKNRFQRIHPSESSDEGSPEAWSPASPKVQCLRRRITGSKASSKQALQVPSMPPVQGICT